MSCIKYEIHIQTQEKDDMMNDIYFLIIVEIIMLAILCVFLDQKFNELKKSIEETKQRTPEGL